MDKSVKSVLAESRKPSMIVQMAIFKRRGRKAERPHVKMFHRDYLSSTFWQLRKRRYFSKYGKECRLCGGSDRADLYHLYDGDYGHERDSDLVALCNEHYQQFDAIINQEGDDFDRTAYIAKQIAWFEAHRQESVYVPPEAYSPSLLLTVQQTLDLIARPIWRLLYGLIPW